MKTNKKSQERIQLINPWSGAAPEEKQMTWREIVEWCEIYIHETNQGEWLREARRAVKNDDGEQLGIMIIGS